MSTKANQTRAYEGVLQWLEGQLRDGEILVGDKLPGERLLAEQFGISRASVREAIRVLDAMGLVRSSSGSGPNSGALLISEPSEALGWALRMHIATRNLPIDDIVATRLLLETQSAVEAAQKGDSPQRSAALARAHQHLERMDNPDIPAEEFYQLDAEFHVILASLAGNVVVETMMDSLRQATIGYVTETLRGREDWPEIATYLQDGHREILAAVEAREGIKAAELLRAHISGFYALHRGA